MNELVAAKLDLIAAKAKQLSLDYRAGRLWEGELENGLAEIHQQLSSIPKEGR